MVSQSASGISTFDLHSSTHSDVIVIGAGAAGLASARLLTQKSLRVRVLEARSRLGGRIHTVRDPILKMPIELGAEFIHGAAPETYELIQHFGFTTIGVSENHHRATANGIQSQGQEWSQITEILGRLRPSGEDRSFAEFLKAQTDLTPEVRHQTQGFIEGFHASDARQISCHSLSDAFGDDEGANGIEEAEDATRILDGYEQIPSALYRACDPSKLTLHLNTVVNEIHWRRGRVDVVASGREGASPQRFSAARAIITLPWGVLQLGPGSDSALAPVKFEPEPACLTNAHGAIAMGHAARINLHFRRRFWSELTQESIGYLHGETTLPFPVWWTPQPCLTPLWIGWVGGPKAQALSALGAGKILDKAIETLGKLLGCGSREVAKNLQTWHYHDWSNDPYSRGAYSFVKVGGVEAAKALSLPVESTLYFAGEATQSGGSRGTVDGALRSGFLAAQYVLSDALAHS